MNAAAKKQPKDKTGPLRSAEEIFYGSSLHENSPEKISPPKDPEKIPEVPEGSNKASVHMRTYNLNGGAEKRSSLGTVTCCLDQKVLHIAQLRRR